MRHKVEREIKGRNTTHDTNGKPFCYRIAPFRPSVYIHWYKLSSHPSGLFRRYGKGHYGTVDFMLRKVNRFASFGDNDVCKLLPVADESVYDIS